MQVDDIILIMYLNVYGHGVLKFQTSLRNKLFGVFIFIKKIYLV